MVDWSARSGRVGCSLNSLYHRVSRLSECVGTVRGGGTLTPDWSPTPTDSPLGGFELSLKGIRRLFPTAALHFVLVRIYVFCNKNSFASSPKETCFCNYYAGSLVGGLLVSSTPKDHQCRDAPSSVTRCTPENPTPKFQTIRTRCAYLRHRNILIQLCSLCAMWLRECNLELSSFVV
jgi:hypothetical protein